MKVLCNPTMSEYEDLLTSFDAQLQMNYEPLVI